MPALGASHEPHGALVTSMVTLSECVRPSQTSCSSPLGTGNVSSPTVTRSRLRTRTNPVEAPSAALGRVPTLARRGMERRVVAAGRRRWALPRPEHLDGLHHPRVLVAEDVAVENEMSGEVLE